MTTDDRCAPIRSLLDGLTGQPAPRPTKCGGAIVPVTHDTWQAVARRHDVDLVLPDSPPKEGPFEARVDCRNDVLAKRGVGGTVHDGTCARCAGVEMNVRKLLAEVASRSGT
jgi:hypothetical protein